MRIFPSLNSLLGSALAPSTLETYRRAWTTYNRFSNAFFGQSFSSPLSVSQICLYVAFLHYETFAPKTISTYLSALGFVHKMQGHTDPTIAFVVTNLAAGAYLLNQKPNIRSPITISILDRLITNLQWVTSSVYDKFLFRAMFLLAFIAFARIGEITVKKPEAKVLQLSDINITSTDGRPDSVSVTFRHYKHNLTSPHTITLGHGPAIASAVQSLADYVEARGRYEGPLFCQENKKTVSKLIFDR